MSTSGEVRGRIGVSEAARLLGVSAQYVRRLADAGRLEAVRGVYGREIDVESVERLAQQRQAQRKRTTDDE